MTSGPRKPSGSPPPRPPDEEPRSESLARRPQETLRPIARPAARSRLTAEERFEARAIVYAEKARRAMRPTMPNGLVVPLPKGPSGLAALPMRLADGLSVLVSIWARAPLGVEERAAVVSDFRKEARRSLSEVIALLPADRPSPPEVAQALVTSRDSVVHEHAIDVWALLRRATKQEGRDKVLFRKLLAEAVPKAGIAAVAEALQRTCPERLAAASLKTLTTMEELNRVIPELTTLEVAVIPLLERVPTTLLESGDGAIGMLRDVHRDGATFARDATLLSKGDAMRDLLGASGVEPGEEFVAFRPPVKRLVTKLLTAALSDAYLFERTFQGHLENCVVRGQAMIAAAGDFRFDSVVERLVTERKGPDKAPKLSVYHLTGFVGMLERVPEVLRGPEPFHGYFVPFGGGVKLVDVGGRTREYVSMHPYLQGEAYEDIFHSTNEDVSPSQPIMSALARQLRVAIEDHVLDGNAPSSRVEQLAADALLRFGVSLPSGGRKFFVSPTHAADTRLTEAGLLEIGSGHAYGFKMGPRELEHTIETLGMIPEAVRQRLFPWLIQRVVKTQAIDEPARVTLGGLDRFGAEYQPSSRSLLLLDCPEIDGPFENAGEHLRLLRRWTMMQQLGRALFEAMPEEGQRLWGELVTASTTDDRTWVADFHDAFAVYVLCGEDFRARCLKAQGGPLVSRYVILRELCEGVECEGMPGLTLEGVEAAIERFNRTSDAVPELDPEQIADHRRAALWSDGRVVSVEQMLEREQRGDDGDPPTLPTKRRRKRGEG